MSKWWEESLLKHQKSVANVLVKKYRYQKWDIAFRKAGWILQELEKAGKSFSGSVALQDNTRITDRLYAMGNRALREINKTVKDKTLKQDAQVMMEVWQELYKKSPTDVKLNQRLRALDADIHNNLPNRKLGKGEFKYRKNIDMPIGDDRIGFDTELSQEQLERVDEGYKKVDRPSSDKFKVVKPEEAGPSTKVKSRQGDLLRRGEETAVDIAWEYSDADIEDTSAKPITEPPQESKTAKVLKKVGKVVKPVAKVLGPVAIGLTVADIAEAHERVVERNETGGRSRDYQKSYEEFRSRNPKTPYDHIKGLMMEAFQ